MNEMIFLPKEEVMKEIQQAVRVEFEEIERKRKRVESNKLLSINAVAKRLQKSHAGIKKLCDNGTIKTTKSGLIEESEIERYLSNT